MIDNVDTDQIIPSREMKTVSREGLAGGLFAGWRYTDAGSREPNPDFVLNQPTFSDTQILISGENFGCGSSREHAVWALSEFGVRAVIAVSFGAIFRGNCSRNGILPVALPREDVEAIAARASEGATLSMDLPEQTISVSSMPRSAAYEFEIEPYAKRLLVEGLDPIGLTLTQSRKISEFIDTDKARRPWIYRSESRPAP